MFCFSKFVVRLLPDALLPGGEQGLRAQLPQL